MSRLNGKIAIITGGARGMGESHVRKFVEEGAQVVFTDVNAERGEIIAQELGRNVKFIKQDVTKASDWEKVVEETEKAFGSVHILINNAGIYYEGTIENTNEEDYRKIMDVNQVGVFLGMKFVVTSMKKTGAGSIINISSLAGLKGRPSMVAYTASKFAVRGMSQVAALEFAKYGIRVNTVYPGLINTPLFGTAQTINTDAVPLKRIAQPEEVTNLVLFLASDESSYCTGSDFSVDGGRGTL